MLLGFALRPIEPVKATRPHNLRDLSAQVKSSGAVGVVDRADFIPGWGLQARNLKAREQRWASLASRRK
jgi:hypothetical protein